MPVEFPNELGGYFLFDNMHGHPQARQYVIVFGRDPPKRKAMLGLPPFDYYRSPSWLSNVREDDSFAVELCARDQHYCTCVVHQAEVETFTSPLAPTVARMLWRSESRARTRSLKESHH